MLVVTFFGGFLFQIDDAAKKQKAEITFCQFSLSDEIKDGNSSFTVGYSFKLDDKGKPKDIKKILGDQLSDEKVISCLSGWHFSDVAYDSLITVFFRWEHAIGWTELTVSGKDFFQKIKIDGEKCPYSGANKPSK